MSNLVVNDSKFPVGASVDAIARPPGRYTPGGVPAETQTVASDGTATFTTLTDSTPYLLTASVNGARQVVHIIKASGFAARNTWKQIVAARRAAIGTS